MSLPACLQTAADTVFPLEAQVYMMPALRVAVTLVAAVALLFVLVGAGHMLPWHRAPPTATAASDSSVDQPGSESGPEALPTPASHAVDPPVVKEKPKPHASAGSGGGILPLSILKAEEPKHHKGHGHGHHDD